LRKGCNTKIPNSICVDRWVSQLFFSGSTLYDHSLQVLLPKSVIAVILSS